MTHRYSVGQLVYFDFTLRHDAAPGQYKIVRLDPIERDDRLKYRIKSAAETFERIAEEHQLKKTLD